MHRIVHHHQYVRRSHADVCDALELDANRLLSCATQAAAESASRIAQSLEEVSEFFDIHEKVEVRASPLHRYRTTGSLTLTWFADSEKRFLPNVQATLELNPVVPHGPAVLTELVLHGEYDPPPNRQARATDFFLERRLANAVLHTFLDNLATAIETLKTC